MTPEQRAYHAKELATNPVLAEVMAELEAAAIDAMTFAKPGDHDPSPLGGCSCSGAAKGLCSAAGSESCYTHIYCPCS